MGLRLKRKDPRRTEGGPKGHVVRAAGCKGNGAHKSPEILVFVCLRRDAKRYCDITARTSKNELVTSLCVVKLSLTRRVSTIELDNQIIVGSFLHTNKH